MDPNLICTFLLFCSIGSADQTACKTYDKKPFTAHIAYTPGQDIADLWTADLNLPPKPALVSMPFNALDTFVPGWQEERPDLKHLGEGGVITFHAPSGIAYSSVTLGLETSSGNAMISILPLRIGTIDKQTIPGLLGHGTCQPFEKEG